MFKRLGPTKFPTSIPTHLPWSRRNGVGIRGGGGATRVWGGSLTRIKGVKPTPMFDHEFNLLKFVNSYQPSQPKLGKPTLHVTLPRRVGDRKGLQKKLGFVLVFYAEPSMWVCGRCHCSTTEVSSVVCIDPNLSLSYERCSFWSAVHLPQQRD